MSVESHSVKQCAVADGVIKTLGVCSDCETVYEAEGPVLRPREHAMPRQSSFANTIYSYVLEDAPNVRNWQKHIPLGSQSNAVWGQELNRYLSMLI